MAEVTHVIVTDEAEHGFMMESPQVPGLFFGRPTQTEFFRDYRQVLQNVGVNGQVKAHRQQRFTGVDGDEYLLRWAEGERVDERLEVVRRVQAVLATESRTTDLADGLLNASGEVVLVAALPEDTIGDLTDQMYNQGDVIFIAVAFADNGLFVTPLASADHNTLASWQSVAERGWGRDTTVSQIMRELAAAPSHARGVLV